MSVERLLQICVAVMALLATMLLGLGQQNVYLPLVALLAASLSLIFTDALSWFRLNRAVANIFALIAASYSLSSFFRFDKEQQLLSIANLMVYLQFILFFQEKSPRVYWQLLVLGLLQVVVAVALSLEAVAAVILVAYMLVGVAALTFFCLHCESFRVTGQLPRTQVTFFRRWKARASRPMGEPPTKPRAVFMSEPRSLAWELVGPQLVRQIAAVGAFSLLFATVLFYTVPRHGDSLWLGPSGGGESTTGFPELQAISFDETGRIAESDEPVMRVAFRDSKTNQPYRVVGRPYFRGIVMMHYSLSKKQWTQRFNRSGGGVPGRLSDPPASQHLVRQEIVLEPSNQELLFSVYPCWRDSEHPNLVALDRANAKLFVPRYERVQDKRPLRYSLVIGAFRNGWQIRASSPRHDRSLFSGRARDYLTDVNADTPPGEDSDLFDLKALPGLAKKARHVVDSAAKIDPLNHLHVAQALEQHFRTSGEYRYSLDFRNFQRDANLDPLEDFVVNHRTGHCEYFAGALALMLRSRNIPSRVVVGYVGSEFNPMGGFYQVRKKDAHAWVEAFIAPRHFDQNKMLLPPGAKRSGIWYRLDPTPAADDLTASTTARSRLTHKFDQFLDYFQFVWSDYVVGLDEKRQQGVFQKLENQPDAIGGSRVRSWLDGAAGKLGLTTGDDGKPGISWPLALGLLTGVLVAGVIVRRLVRRNGQANSRGALTRLVSRVFGIITPWIGNGNSSKLAGPRHKAVHVEFYARLVRIVAPLGLVRAAGQTPQEYAESIRGCLRQGKQDDAVADLPVRVVNAFYRVRFGGAALDTQEQQSIEQALSNLEQVLATHQD